MSILAGLLIALMIWTIIVTLWLQFKFTPPDCPVCQAEIAALRNTSAWVIFCPHRQMKRA